MSEYILQDLKASIVPGDIARARLDAAVAILTAAFKDEVATSGFAMTSEPKSVNAAGDILVVSTAKLPADFKLADSTATLSLSQVSVYAAYDKSTFCSDDTYSNPHLLVTPTPLS